MPLISRFFLLFLPLCLLTPAGAAEEKISQPESILRIAILEKVPSFNLNAEEGYEVSELNTGEKAQFTGRDVLLVETDGKFLLLAGRKFSSPLRVQPLPSSGAGAIRVNGRRYRDSILLRIQPELRVTVINELGLDGYVAGILSREVSPDWPEDALKAQAVVSRTFAVKNLNRHNSEGFNLCSRVHCQVFGGLDAERPRTDRAVEETHNEILLYGEDPVNSVFFSNCGGRTEEPTNAWETHDAVPYLKSVRCRYCRKESHYNWQNTFSEEKISRSLLNKGYALQPPVLSIRIGKTGRSGRARTLKIRHSGGELILRASHFRMAVGPDLVRSTLFTRIKKVKGGFLFAGRGWGHGVGLCQEGAKGMAEEGKRYDTILRFYYPGSRVVRWSETED